MSKFRVIFEPKTLVELSEIEVGKKLWTHSRIRKSMKLKVREFLINNQVWIMPQGCDADEEILNCVFHNIDKLPIPTHVRNNLKILTKKMDFAIWYSLKDIWNDDQIPVDLEEYIDYIKWTKYGDIDKAEVVRSMYYAKILPDNDATWTQLCNFCLEDCITDYFGRRSTLNCPPVATNVFNILPRYWISRMENRLEDFCKNLASLEVSLLIISLCGGEHSAVKYFWDFLVDDQRIKEIQMFTERQWDIAIETVAYFWRPASVYGIDSFFIGMFARPWVMERLIRWPYDDLLMKTLERSLPQLSDSDLEEILDNICKIVENSLTFGDHFGKIQQIFQQVWERIGSEHKSIMSCTHYLEEFANYVETLSCIINDPALKSTRNANINYVAAIYKSESNDRDIRGLVTKFCEVVLKSEKERQAFRRCL